MNIPNYLFSEIPNNDEGRELVRLMRKYCNKKRFQIEVYGQHVKDEYRGTGVTRMGQNIEQSKCLRVYARDKIERENKHKRYMDNWANRQVMADELENLAYNIKHNIGFK